MPNGYNYTVKTPWKKPTLGVEQYEDWVIISVLVLWLL